MDLSLLIFGALIIGYLGAMMYVANVADGNQNPLRRKLQPDYAAEQAQLQRMTILRWMLYGIVALNLVFGLLVVQIAFLGDAASRASELDVKLPKVDQTGAVLYFVLAVTTSLFSYRVVASETTRQQIRQRLGADSAYKPESNVHTVAIVLALVFIAVTIAQLIISGGLSGLAEDMQDSVSTGSLVFQAALFIAFAFLGVGMAIRRDVMATLARLGLRIPTLQDVIWGIGMGIGLFVAQLVMGIIWSALVPAEQIAQQSAASDQIARSVTTLPMAFLVSLTSAVSEEILFRGAIQPVFGLVVTSLFFALVHIQYALTPATLIIFVVALGLGVVRWRQSTSASIITHFIYNFVQLAAAILIVRAAGG
jgi:membrane protease YdiL (CAAX protease family)